jgi:predicted amidohydrolase
MRFPEMSVLLRKKGADILTYPSCFTVATGASHWEILLRCRAIENQCYVVAAAQVGQHNKKRSSYGHAMVIITFCALLSFSDMVFSYRYLRVYILP